ncbi:hypothetical protein D0469_18190 [Peribacillus saganii]|uniref:Uncharacterized protein n=1 Tax=Peribacillus saganii TaxID=2303992 RepID=A0A372LDY9_9BACI|nr:hypothetical protein D0469_18190 [Peribacillus saganii]
MPISISINLLTSLHVRFKVVLKALSETDSKRKIHLPEFDLLSVDKLTATYAVLGRHHAASITSLRKQKGW